MDQLVEHYGTLMGESSIRRITKAHVRQIFETAKKPADWPTQPGSSAVVIGEVDSGMGPIVPPDLSQSDKRKGKMLQWKKVKFCLTHAPGSKTMAYGGT